MPHVETRRIADQLDRIINGPAWLGPAMLESLEGVDAARAAAHPQPGAHSIWELVLHTTTWLDIVTQRLEGTAPSHVGADVDWPSVPEATTARWAEALAGLREAASRLAAATLALDDDRLHDELPASGDTWSAYISLHGVVQHVAYHTGQISLLKKY